MSVADRDQLRELASLHALGVLSAEDRAALAAAMAADPELAAEVRQLEDTVGALGGVAAQIDPPARLRGRVLAVAGIEDTGGGGVPGAPPIALVGSRAARAGDASAAGRGGPRSLPGWLAAAAALVLASGLGLWALQLRGALEAMNARVDRAEAEVVRIQRTLGEAQQQTANLQAHNAVMFAPDTLRVDLAGEGPAPGSTARAFMSRNRGLVVAANALPALPPDKVYQLWVVPGDSSAPISAGLFAPDASGHASLFFPMPANLPVVAALAVTVEPAGGRPAPTGDKALVGAVPTTTAS